MLERTTAAVEMSSRATLVSPKGRTSTTNSRINELRDDNIGRPDISKRKIPEVTPYNPPTSLCDYITAIFITFINLFSCCFK